ncbi:MAG: DNA repair and recombination protein RadA [Nitrososphaeria archaeon]|nr:DNA repair and recombination protein RadA [Nitrososphaeria archaeon]
MVKLVKEEEIEDELDVENIEGVGPATRDKFYAAGIYDIRQVLTFSPQDLVEILGISYDKAVEISNKSRKKLTELGLMESSFSVASEVLKRRLSIDRITTGSNNLDSLLGGGIEVGALTEFYGEFGSGKTQICHTLCVTVQLPREKKGLNAGAVYIDTENTFRPERIESIAKFRGLDPEQVLKRIFVGKVYNASHQELLTREIPNYIEREDCKLVIVDSAMTHFRAEYVGRSMLSERQQKLNRYLHTLLRLAEIYKVAVVITNQVQAAPDVFFGDPTKASGGHVMAHASTYRIYLRKSGKNRIARIVDSPYHAEADAIFTLTEAGIGDPEENSKK